MPYLCILNSMRPPDEPRVKDMELNVKRQEVTNAAVSPIRFEPCFHGAAGVYFLESERKQSTGLKLLCVQIRKGNCAGHISVCRRFKPGPQHY